MKATYKKRVVAGHGLHSGPVTAIQEVQLEIHYEAESRNDPGKMLTCEPYELFPRRVFVAADTVMMSGMQLARLSTLKLVIEEVPHE